MVGLRVATGCALAALVLLAAGCGDDGEEPGEAGPAGSGPAPEPKPKRTDRPIPTGDGRGGVELVEVGSFEQPLHVAQPDDGSGDLYVVEQTGRVLRLAGGKGEPEPFLDLSGEVSCCGEQGLLSVAFAPDYRSSGLLYASYTNSDGDSRVVEYRRSGSDPPVADPESAREVLAQDQPYANHNGGLVLFGPDERLYLGLGDGGSGGGAEQNAQDPSSLLGKLLTIDPRPAGGEAEVVALGLRNPWRFSFDRKTDDLWIGDPGQAALEEIDGIRFNQAEGANFGWPAFEGTQRFNSDQEAPDAIDPVLVYGREGGCSVTGGYVVRDPALRSLYGRYLYGDYCEGELRSFTARPGVEARDDRPMGVEVSALSSFGEDTDGRLYATSLEGPVYRLAPG